MIQSNRRGHICVGRCRLNAGWCSDHGSRSGRLPVASGTDRFPASCAKGLCGCWDVGGVGPSRMIVIKVSLHTAPILQAGGGCLLTKGAVIIQSSVASEAF